MNYTTGSSDAEWFLHFWNTSYQVMVQSILLIHCWIFKKMNYVYLLVRWSLQVSFLYEFLSYFQSYITYKVNQDAFCLSHALEILTVIERALRVLYMHQLHSISTNFMTQILFYPLLSDEESEARTLQPRCLRQPSS